MAMSKQQRYEAARGGLEAAVDNPEAFSEDEIQKLTAIVTEFQGSRSEPTSLLGPTGMDMLEKQVPVAPEAADIAGMIDKYPGAKNALGGGLTDFTAGNPLTKNIEAYQETHDETMPNASKRKDFKAPPEFFPPVPEATTPMEAFGLKLSNAHASLPTGLGGKTQHFLEPSIEQFQRDMGPYIHPDELKAGVTGDAYKEYADQRWQEVYEQAKAEGRPIVRDAYKKDKSWTTRALDKARDTAGGLLAGADKAMMGIPTRLISQVPGGGGVRAEAQKMREESPTSATVGEIGASLLPVAPGSLAARGAGAMLPKAAGLFGATARAGALGAAAGGAQSVASDVGEGKDPSLSSLGTGALFGLPLGAIGGAMGYGARAHGRNLRETTSLGQAERAGVAETGTFAGVKPTAAGRAIRSESYRQSGDIGGEVDMLANRIEATKLEGGKRLDAASQKAYGEARAQFLEMSKETKVPQTDLLKEAMRLHATGVDEMGKPLLLHAPQNKVLQDAIKTSAEFEIVPASGGKANVRPRSSASFDIDPDTATLQGVDVERHMADYLKHAPAPGDYVIRVTPQALNPEKTEQIIAKIGDYLKQGDADKTKALNSLMPFSRAARERFPAAGPISDDLTTRASIGGKDTELKGWAAFQHLSHEQKLETEKVLGLGGLPKDLPAKLDDNQIKASFNATSAYGKPGRSPDLDQALRDLTDPAKLEQMRGMRNLPKLEAQGSMFPSANLRSTGIVGSINPQGARFHLDPMLEAIAPPLLGGRHGAAGGMLGREKKKPPEQLDPITLEQLKAIFGPGR